MRKFCSFWLFAAFASAVCSLFLAVTPAVAATGANICNPRSYGAKGNGVAKDTTAIQRAINACEAKGGGTVVLSPGAYLSGPVVLKSNITLDLKKGATLLGSPDFKDYPKITEFRAPGRQALVSATDASHVSIIGSGTINGNGSGWWKAFLKHLVAEGRNTHFTRPRLIVFDHCDHVLIEGITAENSPMWQIVPYYSDYVTIRNIRVLAPPHSVNTDAVDPFASQHVLIEHVYANVGDDDVAIKSGMPNSTNNRASRYITIKDCTFMRGHGLSIGSEIAGGAQHIYADNITFDGTGNGIRIKANRDRGNDVSDIVFKNIHMKNVPNALIISEFYPHKFPPKPDLPAPVTRLTPHFHNITIENMTAINSRNAGVIAGLPEAPIRGLVFVHVTIDAQKGMFISNAQVEDKDLVVHASEGKDITTLAGAKLVSMH